MRKALLIVMLCMISLSGCSSFKQKAIEDVNLVLEEYELEGTSQLEFDRSMEGYKFYNLTIDCEGFEEKRIQEKYAILRKLDSIDLDKKKSLLFKVYIQTRGDIYNLDYEDKLEKNKEKYPPVPTKTPFAMPSGDFSLSWDNYNETYNSLGGILTITRRGSDYTMKIEMPDGSSGVYDLHVVGEGDEIRLTQFPGNPYGDYMLISSTGDLYFYDNQGLIYTAPLVD